MTFRQTSLFLLLVGLIAAPHASDASECICVQYPMYPYSGGNWLHSAKRTTGNCAFLYPTPHVQAYTDQEEVCVSATDCGDCTGLGNPPTVSQIHASHLHTKTTPLYSQLNEEQEIRDFLKANTQLTGAELALANSKYDLMEFVPPVGAAPPIVKLMRKVGASSEPFYAILWKSRFKSAPSGGAFLAIEIADNPAVTTLTSASIYRAAVMAKNGTQLESVIVKGLLEVEINGTQYLIRLLDSDKNKAIDAFPTRIARSLMGASTTDAKVAQTTACPCKTSNPVVAPSAYCCPNTTQVYYYGRCRGGRRRCR